MMFPSFMHTLRETDIEPPVFEDWKARNLFTYFQEHQYPSTKSKGTEKPKNLGLITSFRSSL